MKKLFLLILCVFTFPRMVFAGMTEQPMAISLSRFSPDRVAAARSHFELRMSHVKRATIGVIGVISAAVLAKYGRGWYRHWYPSKEESEQNEKVQESYNLMCAANSKGKLKEAAQRAMVFKEIREYNKNKGHNPAKVKKEESGIIMQMLKNGFTLGVAGLFLTSGQQVFKVCSGTIEEVVYLWFKGYEHWYDPLVDQLRALMNELRENFYQARKIAQQSNTEQQLLIVRQQRRVPLTYEISTHYRLDIVTMYQRLVSTFERLVALMFIMSPSEHYAVMQQNINAIGSKLNKVSGLLECDLNENTHGMLTLYSNATLDGYHEAIEAINIFLSTYSTYLRR